MATTLVFNPITGNFDSVLLATANVQAWMATPSSANLLAALSDKTGTGLNVFGTAPTLTGPVTLTEAVGSSGLTITGATQTASFPALNITQTNSATSGTLVHASLAPTFSSSSTSTMVGVGFRVAPTINYSNGTPGAGSYEALKIAVTETALPTGQSYLARMSAGAAGTTDKWSVTNSGAVTQAAGLTISSGAIRFANSTGDIGLVGTSIQVVAAGGFSWSTNSTWNSTGDVFLRRDAAGTLALRNSTNAQTFRIYNTYTDSSNYERLDIAWAANVASIFSANAGTGSARSLELGTSGSTGLTIASSSSANPLVVLAKTATSSGTSTSTAVRIGNSANATNTGGSYTQLALTNGMAPTATSTAVFYGAYIAPTINYSNATPGAGSYEALKIAVTETALPTGQSYLARMSAGAAGTTEKWSVTNAGAVTAAGAETILAATAIPAGGTAGSGYKFSSTSNFGVFFGSGAPSLAAAKGSLYLRSDGSGTGDRAYINTDGSTTWTALTTAA